MKTRTITLRNSFHNTEVGVRVKGESPWELTQSQTRRVGRKLCGMPACCCGTIRGAQDVGVDRLAVWEGSRMLTVYLLSDEGGAR